MKPSFQIGLVIRGTWVQTFLVIIYHSRYPVPQEPNVKVDEQSNGSLKQTHVRKELRMVYRMQSFFALELYNHLTFDPHIGAKAALQLDLFIYQGHRFLALDLKPRFNQLILDASLICRFKESRPQCSVNLDASSNDLSGNLVDSRRRD
jgi:hypothetical protein